MFVSHTLRRPPARRGAILIVVLAMLALFAVVGLSFVLYADSQANAAKQNKIAENKDNPPDPLLAAEQWTGVLFYDVTDFGDDLMNPLRGHSLSRSKYGYQAGAASLSPFVGQDIPAEPPPGLQADGSTLTPFTLPGIPPGTVDRRQVVRFTWDPVSNFVVDPERLYGAQGPSGGQTRVPVRQGAGAYAAPLVGTYVNKSAPYTYPNRNNFFLAQLDPTTGQVVAPSFHRADLFTNTNPIYTTLADQIAQSLNPNNPRWTVASPEGRLMTLRPRTAEHPNFPQVPPNADGSYTGDVANLKFLTGGQRNDSLWMDAGGPVLEWRGRKYKAVIAPLVLDLSSRVNLSVAGNIRPADPATVPTHPRHTSLAGYGTHEINPTAVFADPATANAELLAILQKRFPNPVVAPKVGAAGTGDPMYGSAFGRLNHLSQEASGLQLLGQLPPPYSLTDVDGVSAVPTLATFDPMTLPPAGGYAPFPGYPATRYSNTLNVLTANLQYHPSQFNPLQWRRGLPLSSPTYSHPFGMDDLIALNARYTDSKPRVAATEAGSVAPVNLRGQAPNTPAGAAQTRAMLTTFSTSQQWAEVPLATGPGAFVKLGPVDVNRPLADYRRVGVWYNAAAMPPRYEPVPHSPLNMWDPTQPWAGGLNARRFEPLHYAKARLARQTLARDIFVRLVALSGAVTGDPTTGLVYNPATGYFNPIDFTTAPPPVVALRPALRQYAQLAANIVDYVDADDISTAFVWNPINPAFAVTYSDGPPVLDPPATGTPVFDPSADPTNYAAVVIEDRVVYGTELPRLVINEAYSVVANHREDTGAFATRYLKRRYWFELHNPLPADAAQPVLSDAGAARLYYESGVTQLQDPTNPAVAVPYAGATYNPYRVEVAVVPMGMGVQTPYSTYLTASPVRAALDTAGVPGMTLMARVNTYTQDTNAPAPPMPTLAAGADPKNLVLPANGAAAGPNGDRQGYYLIGPRDQFPAGSVTNSLNLPDPPVAMGPDSAPPTAAAPADALTFSVTGAPPTNGDIDGERAKTSVTILRRLANPYLPPQENPANPNFNPYVTTDYLENVPTWDRATKNATMPIGTHTPPAGDDARPTIGRVHPYVAGPTYGSGTTPPAPLVAPVTSDGVRDQVATGMPVPNPPHTLFGANNPLDNGALPAPPQFTRAVGAEWLVHLDRQVINSTELFHVSAQSPALLTQKFFSERVDGTGTSFAPRVFEYQRHTTWNAVSATATDPLVPALRTPNWHRVLDLIVAGNPMPGVPLGGRVPGLMNPNTMNDRRLMNALLDPQPGNTYTTGAYAQNPVYGDVTNPAYIWGQLNSPTAFARTPNGVPRATFAETGVAGGDRPFQSFFGSTDIQDSLLRQGVAGPTGTPVMFNLAAGANHSHVQAEPLRKALNNLTPTSDSFLVVMTVSFFEVENAGPHSVTNQPRLGKELFDRVPGDLRTQYAAVIDRSQLAVHHDGQLAAEGNTGALQTTTASKLLPQQARLLRDAKIGDNTVVIEASGVNDLGTAAPGSLYDNGSSRQLAAGRLLRLGYNDTTGANTGDGEWVRIASVTQLMGPDVSGALTLAVPGHYVVTLDNTFTPAGAPGGWVAGVVNRAHAAGTKVGTVVLGNPGPQTAITIPLLQSRGLMPYFTRLDP